ncbi:MULTISPECIES: glycosyltransferase family 9 protein [unclassified Polynucleobacter]|uniref:glycosyltransferase family 9 protein n=1 Tax=unclassified Polynucleobacter TaxID=2640945 RepID=UPI00257286AE|nr:MULTISPECIES: glycosyltransferase family 9 protein [unclassified Polynucleobacter]BEI42152.1 hypothetical protein PHIN10_03010 [Polynucleobacter sp. HIN10]BEI43930.1 hypothetical protein PHIN11_03020 [Polynucleobacter sp. HIN11]
MKKIIKYALAYTFYFLDSISSLLIGNSVQGKNTVLIFRLDHIGDFLLWNGNVNSLRSKYPRGKYKLVFLANQSWGELVNLNNIFDEVWLVNRKKFIYNYFYRFSIFRKIRNYGFETIINPVFSRDPFWSDPIVRLSNAIFRIGFYGNSLNYNSHYLKNYYDRLYNNMINDINIKSEIEINKIFYMAMGSDEDFKLSKFESNPALLPNLLKDKSYFVLFPGASWSGRRWPPKFFSETANLITENFKFNGVICGALSDIPISTDVINLSKYPLTDLTAKTSLLNLIQIIGNAKLLITNETSAAHIGACTNTPTICIAGGGHFGRFLTYQELLNPPPFLVANYYMDCYGCNWNCKYLKAETSTPCIENVSVEKVFELIIKILN